MKKQNYERYDDEIRARFDRLKAEHPEKLKRRLNFSWSNWGFGLENLETSVKRLKNAGIDYIELHGNHYGADLGYKPAETLKILGAYGMKAAGICGMFSAANDLSGNDPRSRQNAIDYIRRELDFGEAVGASYMLVVPGAVGRPLKYDDYEFDRSVQTLKLVVGEFVRHNIKAVIEPIRSAEVSFIHTFADARRYIAAVDDPGVRHINGDLYHMLVEEKHIGQTIVDAGDMLLNLHMADTNRCALGEGFLDLDTVIRALYLIGYNRDGHYVTPEPLGPGGDPYPAMNGRPDPEKLDALVNHTVRYFRERESELLD